MQQATQVEPQAPGTAPSDGCDSCGKPLREGWCFAFKPKPAATGQAADTVAAEISKCAWCAIRHAPMLRRSLAVALVVGTVLTLLNQGDIMWGSNWPNALYWKIPLTYCVPFCVATYGALTTSRR